MSVLSKHQAERGEIAEPGTSGRLELRAEHEGETLEHAGDYVYVGVVRGLHAFAPVCGEPILYLHRHQVLSFGPDGRTRRA
jgi:hypothetical protein